MSEVIRTGGSLPCDDVSCKQVSPQNDRATENGRPSGLRPALVRPSWLPESVWPFQTVGLEIEGATVAVTDVGQGPPLLFVHTGVWSFIWRDVMLRLASDYRCLCLDAPGTGRSSRLRGKAISLERSARAITAVARTLGLENLTLVLHDLGGPAGIAGALPIAEKVCGIAALNTFGWKPSGKFFRGMLALMGSAPIRELNVFTQFLSRISSTNFGVGRHMDAPSRQAFRAGIDHQARRAFHYYMRDARDCDSLFREVEAALLGLFKELPLITIFGERNDPLGFQARWKSLFPNARQLVVPGGHHFPMCDDPDLVAGAIRSWHRENVAPSLTRSSGSPGGLRA